jgi:hypothetical protein
MAVREEVIVDLKVNAEGVTQVSTGIEQTAASTNNLNASVGSVTASMGALLGSIVKMSIAMRIYNTMNVENFAIFRKVQNITKTVTKGQDTLVRQMTGHGIPTVRQMGVFFGKLALAIGLVIVAMKAVVSSFSVTRAGADALAETIAGLKVIWTEFVIFLGEEGERGKSRLVQWYDDLSKVSTMIKIMNVVTRVSIGLIRKQGEEIVQTTNALLQYQLEVAKGLSTVRAEMAENEKEFKAALESGDRAGAEAAAERKIELLEIEYEQRQDLKRLEADMLEASLDGIAGINDKLKVQIKIAKLRQQRDLIGLELDKKRLEIQKRIDDAFKGSEVEERAALEDYRLDWAVFVAELEADAIKIQKALMSAFGPEIWETAHETFARISGELDEIGEMADEAVVGLTKKQRKAAETRVGWQEMELSGQLAFAASMTGSMSRMAEENFQLQKAFKIGEVLMSTAAAMIRVWDAGPYAAPFLMATVAAQGAASLAAVVNARPGDTGGILSPVYTQNGTSALEKASPDFFRTNQSIPQNQVVLVTEDLNTVQGRVAVTEDRSSIGG